jgi:hypothetical protein
MYGVTNTTIATTCHSSHVDSRPSVILSVVFSFPAKQPKQPNHPKKHNKRKKKTTLTAEQERQAKLRRKKPETQTY